MADVQSIYNLLFTGEPVKVRCHTRQQYEVLRTSLVKKNALMKTLDCTNHSLCGSFDEEKQVGMFQLKPSKRAEKASMWEVLPPDEPTEKDKGK